MKSIWRGLSLLTSGRTALERNLGRAAVVTLILALLYTVYWVAEGMPWGRVASLLIFVWGLGLITLTLRCRLACERAELARRAEEEARRLGLTADDARRVLTAQLELDTAKSWLVVTIAFLVLGLLVLMFPF